MNRFYCLVLAVLVVVGVRWERVVLSESAEYAYSAEYVYSHPIPNAELVNAETTIGIRHGDSINPATIGDGLFTVVGSVSGGHEGNVLLALDDKTIIFEPNVPFTPGETVTITVSGGVETVGGTVLDGMSYSVTVSQNALGRTANHRLAPNQWFDSEVLPAARQVQSVRTQTKYKTVPATFPEINVEVEASDTAEGLIFLSNFTWGQFDPVGSYLMIIEETGELVYFKPVDGAFPIDFHPQAGNRLSYGQFNVGGYTVMNQEYNEVEFINGANGYAVDTHELILTEDDHAIYMIYDGQLVDMSQIVPGGDPAANVIGLVLHELDADRNVIFEWRSWDHFEITDASDFIDLTASTIDYAHGNSIEVDTDGHWLVSSRTMDEVTKINRETGEITWRMGGKQNQFDFGDDPSFFHQHDARRLPNGNLAIFDNRTTFMDYSRYVEYEVDETNLTATNVWEYRTNPDTFSRAMGNGQTLPNGNVMIGWGSSAPGNTLTEIKRDGSIALAIDLQDDSENPAFGEVSYRALRHEWEGIPETPVVVFGEQDGEPTLFFSANGMTSREEYIWVVSCVFADESTQNFKVETTGFEDSLMIGDLLAECVGWRVTALNTVSMESYTGDLLTPSRIYVPLLDNGG